jgi:hypothetical protein
MVENGRPMIPAQPFHDRTVIFIAYCSPSSHMATVSGVILLRLVFAGSLGSLWASGFFPDS